MSVILVTRDSDIGAEIVCQSWDGDTPPAAVRLPDGQMAVGAHIGDRIGSYEFRLVPAPGPVRGVSFVARDMLALLTPGDRIAIDRALRVRDPATGDLAVQAAAMVLLWESLQAQGDAPISATAERFLAGWAGLSSALGDERAGEIAAALGIGPQPGA